VLPVTSIDKKLTLQVVIWSLLAGLVFSGIQMVVDIVMLRRTLINL